MLATFLWILPQYWLKRLPYLPSDSGVKLVGQAILTAAAKQASRDRTRSFMLLLSVASIRRSEDGIDDNDITLFTESAPFCNISSVDKNALVSLAVSLNLVSVTVRCLPFLILTGLSDKESSHECSTCF